MVDRDRVFAQVNIAFGNAGTFCYTHSCSKEHSHDGEPMAVCRGLGNKTQEILLLRFSECDPPFRLWSAAIRLELAVNAFAGIFADVIIIHGHFKRRVNNGVDALQRVDSKAMFQQFGVKGENITSVDL